MKLKNTLLFSALFLTSLANAAGIVPESSCSDVDIRDKNPALREFFSTPRDQGNYGWCYGFTAADLMTVETGTPISSAHVAAIYNKSIIKNPLFAAAYKIGRLFSKGGLNYEFEGGFITKAMKESFKAKKVCSEMRMPYRSASYLLFLLEDSKNSFAKSSEYDQQGITQLTNYFKILGITSSAEDVFRRLKKEDLNLTYERILSENCQNFVDVDQKFIHKSQKPYLNADEDFENAKLNYLGLVNAALENGKPVGIEYDVKAVVGESGGHASVVMARRYNNGKCEYKVRNSWGQTCKPYKAGIDCNESEGSFWVSDNMLFDMVYTINYLD